jgi:very-short-patch-repair endonuclease
MRHRLLSYMLNPQRRSSEERNQTFDSEFERLVYQIISARGYHVRTQVCVGDPTNHRYRIDLVVEGMQGRLAVECDGDEWHGPDRYEQDMSRQRDLERAGWHFARIRGGDFYRDSDTAMQQVWAELNRLGIRPGGLDASAAQPPQPNTIEFVMRPSPSRNEALVANAPPNEAAPQVEDVPDVAARYGEFEGQAGPDPRGTSVATVAAGLCRIIEKEGPVVAKRVYDIYLRGCGVRRMGGELKSSMNSALARAIREGRVVREDESGKAGFLLSVVRTPGTPAVVLRELGPRKFEDLPPSELQFVARRLVRDGGFDSGSEEHLRAILAFYGLQRLTALVESRIVDILNRRFPYVEDILKGHGGR